MEYPTDKVPTKAIEAAREAFREHGGVDNPWALVNALAAASGPLAESAGPDRSKARCPKCGSPDTSCTHVEKGKTCGSYVGERRDHFWHSEDRDERLHRTCRGCRHEWDTYDVLAPATT